jgi:hypothetical protein
MNRHDKFCFRAEQNLRLKAEWLRDTPLKAAGVTLSGIRKVLCTEWRDADRDGRYAAVAKAVSCMCRRSNSP